MVAVIHSWFQTQTAQVEMVNVTSDGPGTWGGEAGWESRGWRRSGGGGGWGLWGRPGSGEKGVRMKGEARGGGAGAGDNLGGFGDKRLKLSGKRNQQRPLSRRRVGGGGAIPPGVRPDPRRQGAAAVVGLEEAGEIRTCDDETNSRFVRAVQQNALTAPRHPTTTFRQFRGCSSWEAGKLRWWGGVGGLAGEARGRGDTHL